MRRSGGERRAVLIILCFASIILFYLSTFTCSSTTPRLNIRRTDHSYTQGAEHRRLGDDGGPGSYPPRCTDKCGGCTPCIPVHVPVPPVHTTEYYPEAWRCKCGGKLYTP